MGIGTKLNALLVSHQKKPATLAGEIGVSKNTIYSIIKRDNGKVEISLLEQIADYFGISIDYFFNSSDAASLDAAELRLLAAFRNADERARSDAIVLLQAHRVVYQEGCKCSNGNGIDMDSLRDELENDMRDHMDKARDGRTS